MGGIAVGHPSIKLMGIFWAAVSADPNFRYCCRLFGLVTTTRRLLGMILWGRELAWRVARLFKLEFLVEVQTTRITHPRDIEASIEAAAARCLVDADGRPLRIVTAGSGTSPMVEDLRVVMGRAKRWRNV